MPCHVITSSKQKTQKKEVTSIIFYQIILNALNGTQNKTAYADNSRKLDENLIAFTKRLIEFPHD